MYCTNYIGNFEHYITLNKFEIYHFIISGILKKCQNLSYNEECSNDFFFSFDIITQIRQTNILIYVGNIIINKFLDKKKITIYLS